MLTGLYGSLLGFTQGLKMALKQKILIVDDNPVNIDILQDILEEDYELESAQSGEIALKIAPEFIPDLILLDIMMPGINGYDVCRRLRINSKVKGTKIIMVSAKTEISERLLAYELGADDYLTKPFDPNELLAKVRVYLRLKTVEEVDILKTELLKHLCQKTVNPIKDIIEPLISILDNDRDIPLGIVEKVRKSYSGAVNLQQLLKKVNVLNSIKSGSLRLNLISEDLVLMVRKVIEELANNVTKKGLTLHQRLPEKAIVYMDVFEVKRVIKSILDNAIRFSEHNGRIIIEISEANNRFFLSVIDQGEGMNPEFATKMFEGISSLREENQDDNLTLWNGLNLSLAHLIISMHNGALKVDTIKGQGTNMIVILPSARLVDNTRFDLETSVMDAYAQEVSGSVSKDEI